MVSPPLPMPPPPPSSSSSAVLSKTELLDGPLRAFGFDIELISPHKVSGRFQVTPNCCQPFKVLHGGVSAVIAEGLASIGAYTASGNRRVAGIQLSINHFKSAKVDDVVLAEATPLSAGKTIQVWQVQFWKIDSSNSENKSLIASSKVTIVCNIRENPKDTQKIVKYAKL